MSLGRTRSVSLDGVTGHVIEVEADIGVGLPKVVLVGLPDTSLSEARDRCRAAVTNSGHTWPNHRVTVGLSPASLPKTGSHYDLAIAVAVLAAAGVLPRELVEHTVILGELALDGRLRAVPGVLPAAMAAAAARSADGTGPRRPTQMIVPEANLAEASCIEGVDVIGVRSLRHVASLLIGEEPPDDPPVPALSAQQRLHWRDHDRLDRVDLADVIGQEEGRYSIEVAAAGGHHLLLVGPPGSGKTMLAERLPGLLPDLDQAESLEVSAIHSVAGLLGGDEPLLRRPPYQDPHHTSSVASIVGGGSRFVRPGAMSMTHHGVLFLDEASEFATPVLEALRQPLESGRVTIGRAERTTTFPAHFQLVLATNPCKCGPEVTDPLDCTCSPAVRRRHLERLSGPILDRIDIRRTVRRLAEHELRDEFALRECSATVRERVVAARARQCRRYDGRSWRRNAEVPGPQLRRWWPPTPSAVSALDQLAADRRSSARGLDRTLRLAWTVADLTGAGCPDIDHVAIAHALRMSEPLPAPVVAGR